MSKMLLKTRIQGLFYVCSIRIEFFRKIKITIPEEFTIYYDYKTGLCFCFSIKVNDDNGEIISDRSRM